MEMSADASDLPPIDATPLVAEVDAALLTLLRSLGDEDRSRPTIAGAWTVRDVTAHLLDTALRRLSFARDGWLPRADIRTDADLVALINAANAEGVRALGRLSPAVLIALMELATTQLSAYLRSLDPRGPAAFPVSWAGEGASPHWFDVARELTERWHHQQQIRDAVDKPGIMTPRLYRPVLDCFLRALPYRYRSVEAPAGSVVQVVVAGECGGEWNLERRSSAWRLIASRPSSFAARATIPQEIAWRVFTKGIDRESLDGAVRLEGDESLARPTLGLVAIVG
jgi:uncharacterized protein (TIGR03083 family)